MGGSVKGFAFGDGGLCVRAPIAKAGGLDAAARMPARDTKNPVFIGMTRGLRPAGSAWEA